MRFIHWSVLGWPLLIGKFAPHCHRGNFCFLSRRFSLAPLLLVRTGGLVVQKMSQVPSIAFENTDILCDILSSSCLSCWGWLLLQVKKQYDSFQWKAERSGEYVACFSNEFSTFSHKLVYIDFQASSSQ